MEKWDIENETSGGIFDFRNGFCGKFWPRKRYNITHLGLLNFSPLCPIGRPSLPEPCHNGLGHPSQLIVPYPTFIHLDWLRLGRCYIH